MVEAMDMVREGPLSGLTVRSRTVWLVRVEERDGESRIDALSSIVSAPDSLLRFGITLPLMV